MITFSSQDFFSDTSIPARALVLLGSKEEKMGAGKESKNLFKTAIGACRYVEGSLSPCLYIK